MTASPWDKFLLLSWKNWIIQLRHPIQTLFEVLVPVLVCALLILVRGLVEVNNFPNDSRYTATLTSHMIGDIFFSYNNKVLAYSPENPVLEAIVSRVSENFNFEFFVGKNNASDLENYAMSFEPFASIEFDDHLKVSQ